jgi:DNA repair exonuclease SbcCD ATPase subunit
VRIRRLAVRDLRRYRDLELELAPGLTVVRGPNEAGKTTIQRAIELVLTRRATSAAADLEAARSWDAATDARTEIDIDFEAEDEDGGLHPGQLRKAFRGAKGTVELAYDGETVSDPALADQVMAELTGIPSEAFFRSTASIRHHEVDDLDRDEAALRDRLQASISGADRGTSRARKVLDRALHDLTTKGEKNPGRIKVALAAVAAEQGAVEQGELGLAQLERDRDTLTGARERRADAQASLATSRAMLEKARQAERLHAERTTAQERFERYRKAVETHERITELSDTHPSPVPLAILRRAVTELRTIDGRIRELQAMLAGEIEVKYEVETPQPTWVPTAAAALIAVIVGAVIATGQGSFEAPDRSREFSGLLHSKGIPHWLDVWGHDVNHDWVWWRKMLPYYLGKFTQG